MAEAGRTGDSHVEAQRICQAYSRAECILPILRHIGKALFHYLRRVEIRVEDMETTYADAMHPFYILTDPSLADIPVHPMPPDHGLCAPGWFVEHFPEGGGNGVIFLRHLAGT